jgi:hypothetical protein
VLNYAYACSRGVERVMPFEIPHLGRLQGGLDGLVLGPARPPPSGGTEAAGGGAGGVGSRRQDERNTAAAPRRGPVARGMPREVVEALGWRCPRRRGGARGRRRPESRDSRDFTAGASPLRAGRGGS